MQSDRAVPYPQPPASGPRASRRTRVFAAALSFCLVATGSGHRAAVGVAQEPPAQPPSRDDLQEALERQRAREREAYARAHDVSVDEAARRLRWMMRASTDLVDRGRRDLGSLFGGVWIDSKTGRVKLGVVGESEADKSSGRAALDSAKLEDGGDVVSVEHGEAKLEAVSDWLRQQLEKPNDEAAFPVVFGTRTDANAVAVQIPAGRQVTAEQRAVINEAVERFGNAVLVDEYIGQLKERTCSGLYCEPPLRAGVWIEFGAPHCTSGFVATGRGSNHDTFLMTAGHCNVPGTLATRFAQGGGLHNIGPFQNHTVNFFGDAGILRINNVSGWNPLPYVYVTQSGETPRNEQYKIRHRGTSVVGMDVCTSGASLGYSECGQVTEVNHVDAERGVGNQTRGTFCGVGGDSGAPMWKNDTAYGLHVAGYSDCDSLYTERDAAEDLTNTDIQHWDV